MERHDRKHAARAIRKLRSEVDRLRGSLGGLAAYQSPVEFAGGLDLRKDLTAKLDRVDLSLTPYLIDPLKEWDFSESIREVTVVAPEQTGKTCCWIWGLMWSFIFKPCLSIVCYPSDDHAAEANYEKLMPLMRGVRRLADELDRPKAKTRDHFHFSNLLSYFMGSGSRVTSKSAMIRIADELDDWIRHDGQVDNLQDLRKRSRQFDESMLYKVCSPTSESGAIWREFLSSSQGFWHLRCLGCGKLTIRSCDIYRLQFRVEKDDELGKVPVAGSERLVCPKCGREHVESDKAEMNAKGGYRHKKPSLIGKHSGYQWGALASQWQSLNWNMIAAAQLRAGSSGRKKDQIYFDNSIRGLPFEQRKISDDQHAELVEHCAASIPLDKIEAIFLVADTQDYGWKWEIRGFDTDSNRWSLAYGLCEYLELSEEDRAKVNEEREKVAEATGEEWEPVTTVEDLLEYEVDGMTPALAMIDEGGHRKKEVFAFAVRHDKVWTYKGDNRGMDRWRVSDRQEKLILAKENEYKSDLLYYLYNQKRKENNYWFLPRREDVTADYLAEIGAMKPTEKVDGHLYENWEHQGRVHDFFDTGKMYLCLEEAAIESLDAGYFRHCEAAILVAPEADDESVKEVQALKSQKSSWMQGYKGMS